MTGLHRLRTSAPHSDASSQSLPNGIKDKVCANNERNQSKWKVIFSSLPHTQQLHLIGWSVRSGSLRFIHYASIFWLNENPPAIKLKIGPLLVISFETETNFPEIRLLPDQRMARSFIGAVVWPT